jgi:hypothetical protein
MDRQPEVLDFVKAVSDPERLRVIGALALHPATVREIAAQLNVPFREAFKHVGMLEFAGLVHKDGDLFTLDSAAMEKLSKQQFSAPVATPVILPPELDPKSRRVLETFLKPDVAHRRLPVQASKLRIVLDYAVTLFEPGEQYTERQVNDILRAVHPDVASLRRALVDAGLLSRESDGSRYWRPTKA